MLLHTFKAVAGALTTTFPIEISIQELGIRRVGPLSAFYQGLLLGIPETISTEITHPVRDRARGADNVYLSHAALWGQHGRGPIPEYTDLNVAAGTFETRIRYYIGDQGPIEILADDRFRVTFTGVEGCTYEFHGPEQQLLGQHANRYTLYDPGLILPTDRNRRLDVSNKLGIILPNRPDIISDIVLTTVNGAGEKADKKLTMYDVMSVQTDSNPAIVMLETRAIDQAQRDTDLMSSGNADLLLLMFNGVTSILIDNILGQELRYTLVSVVERS